MNVTVQGKQLNVGDALKTHVSEKLEDLNSKFFNRAIDGSVVFSKEGHGFYRAHITIHVGKDILVQAHATEDDPYLSFDIASGKIARQMRRYKNRLRDHRDAAESTAIETASARDIVFAHVDEQDNQDTSNKDPVVIAEMTTNIPTLAVADAVMRLDLSAQSALLFRNPSHGRLNMVYRRADGNIGWVDPTE